MKALVVLILLALCACSGTFSEGNPCDRCDNKDYYYNHPYYCQECLQRATQP